MEPNVSVIMSTYNESINELNDSILSILNQTYKNFEFIILDDNPRSLTMERYLKKVMKKDKRIHLFFNKHNLGASKSRNKGCYLAHGKFIAIMDADDIANKFRLFDQISFLQNNDLDLVFPNYRKVSNKGEPIEKENYNIKSIVDQAIIQYMFGYIDDLAINSGLFMKRSSFMKLHGYRNIVAEDYDFLARAIIEGYKLGYQSKVLMDIRYRPDSITRNTTLKLYLTLKYIQKYLREKHGVIFSIKDYRNFIHNHIYKINIQSRFAIFVNVGHLCKCKFSVLNVIKLIYYMLTTKYALNFLYNRVITSIKLKCFHIKFKYLFD